MHEDSAGPDASSQTGAPAIAGTEQAIRKRSLAVPFLPEFHRRADFICSKNPDIQQFLRADYVRPVDYRYTKVFVLSNPDDQGQVWGYYTLSAGHISKEAILKVHRRKMLESFAAPMVLLGRLGRCDSAPKGLGAVLLADAALRVSEIGENLGVWGIMLHATNHRVMEWYEEQGYRCVSERPIAKDAKPLMFATIESLVP